MKGLFCYLLIIFSYFVFEIGEIHTLFLLTITSTAIIYLKLIAGAKFYKKMFYGFINIIIMLLSFIYIYNSSVYVDRVYLSNGDRTVIVQGMIHYADSEFYKEVNQFISDKKSEGYLHYYELIKILPEHEGAFDTDVQKYFKNKTNSLSSQFDYFKMEKEDIRADVDSNELIKGLNDKGLIVNKNASLFYSKQEIDTMTVKIGLNVNYKTSSLIYQVYDYALGTNLYQKVILDRNKVAVYYVLKTDSNLVLSYGNAHVDGIVSLLKDNGFSVYKKEKVLGIK